MGDCAGGVAHAAVSAIRRNKRMVVMTPAAWFLVSLKRFVPGVMDFMFHLGRRTRIKKKLMLRKNAA